MDPEVELICLRQGNGSLEDHTHDFLNLVNLTDFPDFTLIDFYCYRLDKFCKYSLICDGTWGSLICYYFDYALPFSGSTFTVGEVKEDTTH